MAEKGRLSGKWRGFLGHLGPYATVITGLGIINLLTSDYPWFIWPAMGWGVGLAFHLLGILLSEMKHLGGKWRSFLSHFGSYAIIMSLLVGIYLMTDPGGYPWFIWPALGWGMAVAFHLFGTIAGKTDAAEAGAQAEQAEPVETAAPQARPAEQPARKSPPASAALQSYLEQARTYQAQIQAIVAATDSNSQARLRELVDQVEEWTGAIETLARRIDRFQQDAVIRRDLAAVPQSISKLEAQLAAEPDNATRAELQRTLDNRKKQLAALEHLQNTMRRAEIKMESTLSSLGTIYSQLLTSQSTHHVADYSRLSAEADEEVRTLQDHLEALEEVKLGDV